MCIVLLTIMQCKECGPTSCSLYNNNNTQWNFDKVYIYIYIHNIYTCTLHIKIYIHTQQTYIHK